MDKEFLNAFAEVVREQITQKNEVTLKNVGTFSHEHRKQFQQQLKDGRVVMIPPKDTIVFNPEKEKVYG